MSSAATGVDVRASWWHDDTLDLGVAATLDVTRVAHERTPRHEIEVLAHERLGWAFALDGRLQHVQEDPGPREMLAHVPLLGRPPGPARVLVVGGGDGAVLHEVLKHPSVTHVDVLEPEAALAGVAARLGFDGDLADPRVTVSASLAELTPGYGVILVARPLHTVPELGPLLSESGVLVEWDLPILAKDGPRWARRRGGVERLGVEQRYLVASPLLPGGFAGYSLHTARPADHSHPHGTVAARHYTAELHRAAFALPAFWRDLP